MEENKHAKNADEGSYRMKLFESDEQRWHKGHDHSEVRDQIEDAGNERGEKREVESDAPEEKPARDDQNQAYKRRSDHVAAQHVRDVGKCLLDTRTLRGGEQLHGCVPHLALRGEHEEQQKGNKCCREHERVQRTQSCEDGVSNGM